MIFAYIHMCTRSYIYITKVMTFMIYYIKLSFLTTCIYEILKLICVLAYITDNMYFEIHHLDM